MIEVKHLKQLVALNRYGSFRQAGKELGLSQPALSRSIQSLEKSLGTQLFDRQPSGLILTPAGALVLDNARKVLSAHDLMKHDLDQLLGRESGELIAGIGTYPAEFLFPQTISRLTAMHPKLHIQLIIDSWTQLLPRLIAAEIELALINTDELPEPDKFRIQPLRPREAVLFVRSGHPILKQKEVSIAALSRYPVASPQIPRPLAELLNRRRTPEIECNSISTIKIMVAASDAIGIVFPESLDLEPDAWVILPTTWGAMQANFGIVTRAGTTLSPMAQMFIGWLLDADQAGAKQALTQ